MMTSSNDAAVEALYRDLARSSLSPLWTARADLMPSVPQPKATAHRWRWEEMLPLASRCGELVPVGRGGERRALALANPGLGGQPYATSTLWAALQYLGPGEVAPAHRHSQSAFRFVLCGGAVWTVVNGDPVAMRRGDLLLTDSWHWHEHHNAGDDPMVWLDGLDIPLVSALDAGFFDFGPDEIADRSTPSHSRSEALWGQPGLRPIGAADTPTSPLMAYRWEHTDAALTAQLRLDAEEKPGAAGPGRAGVRFVNPANGRDALTRMRLEMHRLSSGSEMRLPRTVGSSVWQVFDGNGTLTVDERAFLVGPGDVVAVPPWSPLLVQAASRLDLFAFSDAPAYEALGLECQAGSAS